MGSLCETHNNAIKFAREFLRSPDLAAARPFMASVMFKDNMNKIVITLSIFFGLLIGCVNDDEKVLLSDTWACPENAKLETWPDGYPGDEKKFKAIGCRDRLGNRVGHHIAWRDYGIKEHEGGFINDEPDGEWSYYHTNGALYQRGFMKNGKKEGIWSNWDENGNFQYDVTYRNDVVVKS